MQAGAKGPRSDSEGTAVGDNEFSIDVGAGSGAVPMSASDLLGHNTNNNGLPNPATKSQQDQLTDSNAVTVDGHGQNSAAVLAIPLSLREAGARSSLGTPASSSAGIPPPVVQPIVSPDLFGTRADLALVPSYAGFSTIPQNWVTSRDIGFRQITPYDETGSAILVADYGLTRPADDLRPGTAYVVEMLVDYNRYGSPVYDNEIPILSRYKLDPGQSLDIQYRIVSQYAYPNGLSGNRVTLTLQHTEYLVYYFSNDPFADSPPTAPTIAPLSRTRDSVDLIVEGGTDDKGIIGYKIYRNGEFVANVGPDDSYPDNTFIDVGLQYGLTYTYTARAVDTKGQLSPDSVPLLITGLDTTPPTAPTLTTTDRTTTTVDLVVGGSTDDVGVVRYAILRDGVPVGTANSDGTFKDVALIPDTLYTYTARAVDAQGNTSPDSAPPLVVTTNTDPNVPNADDVVEGAWERLLWISNFFPITSNVLNFASIFVDLNQLAHAIATKNNDDIVDEAFDLFQSLVGTVIPYPASIVVNPLLDYITNQIKTTLLNDAHSGTLSSQQASRTVVLVGPPNECFTGTGLFVCLPV